MAEQMYLEFPLKPEYVEDFFELCNSELGFALTKKQPGFISAECSFLLRRSLNSSLALTQRRFRLLEFSKWVVVITNFLGE